MIVFTDQVEGYETKCWDIPIDAQYQFHKYNDKQVFARRLEGKPDHTIIVGSNILNTCNGLAATILAQHNIVDFAIVYESNMGPEIDFYLKVRCHVLTAQNDTTGKVICVMGYNESAYIKDDRFNPFGMDKIKDITFVNLQHIGEYDDDKYDSLCDAVLSDKLTKEQITNFERITSHTIGSK